ncbi:MAG: RNA pseudouridine synthase [Clostridia bacterium]
MKLEEYIKKLNVLYEDNHIIVVEKMVRVPMQKDISEDISMIDIVKEYLKIKYNKPGNVYLGMVHRLDRMVGGIVVFAKTSKAMTRLSETIRTRKMTKKYLAVLNGELKGSGTLENYLVKNEKENMSSVCKEDTKNAKLAVLDYSVIENANGYTLVDVNLHTGRHHQIRVQFTNIGHPLFGDQKYGQKINKIGDNIALYAYSLSFAHPVSKEVLKFEKKPAKLGGFKYFNI